MADSIEEIKNKLGIYEVVGQYVQLKKAGANYKGLCPFHGESTPSFVVSPQKQIFHCFGCGKGGDLFTFIEEIEGLEFRDALKVLADRAGVKLEEHNVKQSAETKSKKEAYFQAQELAADFFVEQLWKTEDGKKVLDYLHRRGLDDQLIRDFRLGFAPEEGLYNQLLKKGVEKQVMLDTGLVAARKISAEDVYDKFRKRLMFPIFNYLGRICGFGGRALSNDQMPKYLNSPESVIYNKSAALYGLFQAKQAIKQQEEVVFVEGYFDVLLPFSAGVKHVVASCGTALTADQVRMVSRLAKKAITCFDNDNAGFEATKRAYEVLFKEGFLVKTLRDFGEFKDVAELVRSDVAAFPARLAEAREFVLVYLEKLVAENDLDTFEGRRVILDNLLPILRAMLPMEQDFFGKKIAARLGVQEQVLYEEMKKMKVSQEPKGEKLVETKIEKPSLEQLMIGLLMEHPQFFVLKPLTEMNEDFFGDYKEVYNALRYQYNSSRENFKSWDFSDEVFSAKESDLRRLMLIAEERYEKFSLEILEQELGHLVTALKTQRKTRDLETVARAIREAERQKDFERIKELLRQQQQLLS